MAARAVLLVPLLLLCSVAVPTLALSSQLAGLWDLFSKSPDSGKTFKILPGNGSGVVQEEFSGEGSESILVSSFSEPSSILSNPVQLRLAIDVEATVAFQCSESEQELFVVSYISGPSPDTELGFDNATNTVHFNMHEKNTSSEFLASSTSATITVHISPGLLARGSAVVLSHPQAKLAESKQQGDTTACDFSAIVSARSAAATSNLCLERETACEHHCVAETGECACRMGYAVHATQPSKCLATHTVSVTIPGASKSIHAYGVPHADFEALLASQFNGMIGGGGVHRVSMKHDTVNISTVETATESAVDVAHRLRRSLSIQDQDTSIAGLQLTRLTAIRLVAPDGLSSRGKRQASCQQLGQVLSQYLTGFDLSALILPTDLDLASLCPTTADIVSAIGTVTIPIPVPNAVASTLLPDRLVLQDTVLTLTAQLVDRSVTLTAATNWIVGSTPVAITITFDVNAGTAVVTGDAQGLSVADIFSLLSPSLATTAGLDGVAADEVGFELVFGRNTPTTFYFRLLIQSAQNLARNLIGTAGLPVADLQSALEAANLDSFDITNVEFLVTNEGGRLCIKVSGNPVLPAFEGVPMSAEIKAIDVGWPNRSVSFSFLVDGSINVATAIKGFIPTLDLTGVPGISSLQLPEFAMSFRRPRIGLPALPPLPNFRVPNIRLPSPKLSIPRLQLPGINFNANFQPQLPSLPDLFSISAGIGVGPLCLNLKNEADGSAASLTAVLQVIFPSLDISSLGIPDTFQNLLSVEVEELCYNSTLRTFTAALRYPGTIEMVPSKPGYVSLTNTMVRVVVDASRRPVRFDFSAASEASLGTFPLQVSFKRDRSGSFMFSATPVQDTITSRDIVSSFGSAGSDLASALDDLQLSDVTLSNLLITAFNRPDLTLRFTATVSYRDLPSVTFELVLSKPFTSQSLLALGIRTTSATLANVVKSVIPSADISDLPFVGDFTVPAVGVLLSSRNVPEIRTLPFVNADLSTLASRVSNARISLLFPVTFPRVGRKDFVAAFRGLSFDFQPPDDETSLLDLAQLALPGVNLGELSPPEGLPGLDNVFIDRLFVDVPGKMFCIEARVAGITFAVIPNALSMGNIKFLLCLEKDGRTTRRNFMVEGDITLGQVTSTITLQQNGNLLEASSTISQRLTISDILTSFGASFIPGGDELSRILQQNGFNSFGISNTVIVVKRRTGGPTNVLLSSTAAIQELSADIEVLFTGLGTPNKKSVAVLALPSISLPRIVDMLSGLDLSGLPFFGDLEIPATTVTISNADITSLPDGLAFTNTAVSGARFARGAALSFLQNIGGQLKTFKTTLRPDSFNITLDEFPTLHEALALIFPGVQNLDIYRSLPNVVPGVFDLRVNRIAYNKQAGSLAVEASLDSFVLIPNLLEISTSTVKASITKRPAGSPRQAAPSSSQIKLSIEGTVTLFGLNLNLNINYNQATNAFGIRITSPSGEVKFDKLFDLIDSAANDLTNPAVAALQLKQSSIRDPLFEVNTKSGNVAFRIRGTPTMTGFGLFTVEALANTSPRQFILTLNAKQFSMAKMLEVLTGLDLSGIPFLGLLRGPSNIGITLSATNVPRIPFPITSYPLNETTSIDRGLGFTVAFRLPADCASDPICNFFRLILGDQSIIFRVTGINGPQATIAYRLPAQLSLGPVKLYNVDFGFSVSATAPPTVGLTNIELDVPVPSPAEGQEPLKFRGKLLIDPSSNVEAALQMIGIYENAFGIPVFSFGNVDLGFRTNIACPICVSQLRFGGEVALGRRCYRGNRDNCVIAQCIFNIDAVDVKNNYFYFAVNRLSYRHILTAVGIPDNPGLVLLDAVEIRDVESSYSSIDRNIPSGILPGGKTIKAGLVFKGIFNILFLVNVKVDVAVELLFGVPKSVNALVEVAPINLGVLQVSAASDSRKGAKFELKATVLPPSFFVEIDGRIVISALRFSASALIKIDNNGLFIRLAGPIFGLPSTFELKAQFADIRNPKSFTNFGINGCFSTLGARVVQGVKAELQKASNGLRQGLDAATSALGEADRAVSQAVGTLNIKGSAERSARAGLDSAQNALNRARDTVRGLCSIRDCNRRTRVPKPCIVQRCSCAIPYPCCRRWRCSTCCRTVCVPTPGFCGTHEITVVDPACVTANGLCEGVRHTAYVALRAAEGTLNAAKATVSAAAEATAVATRAVASARVLSTAAKGVQTAAQASFSAITSAISGILNAFRINGICFDVTVNSVGGGSIGVSMDLVAAGTRHQFSETINLNDIAAFASKMARRFYGNFF
ncbi:uncharacterized protein LOC135808686 [Sycon ciliatum]|uniref:uncharacterized protein LOC135808686 n=1 Tax=Sycon ciliatum TaxID=27933 RepID=UPI0031F6B235